MVRNRPWGSPGRIWRKRQKAGLTTSIWPCGGFYQQSEKDSRTAKTRLLPFNTLRRHLYTMGLIDSPWCRRCGTGEKTSAHVLRECKALATLRRNSLGSFFLDPEDVRSGGEQKETGLSWHQSKEHKGPAKGLRASAPKGVQPICYSILFYSIVDCILCLNIAYTVLSCVRPRFTGQLVHHFFIY